MTINTTLTSTQLISFLEMLRQKGITPETFKERVDSGVLLDIFEPDANFSNRSRIRLSLGLLDLPVIILDLESTGMRVIQIPQLGNFQVNAFLVQNNYVPVTYEEAERFAAETNFNELIVAMGCRLPDSKGIVGIHNKTIVNGGASFYYAGTYCLVKKKTV